MKIKERIQKLRNPALIIGFLALGLVISQNT